MTMEIAEEDARERVMHISNDIFGEQDIFYPTALEQQIVSGVLSGSEAQVASAFEILCQENFTLRRITDMKSRLLVERLAMTISAPLLRMTSLPDEIKLNTLRAIAKCKNQNHYRSFFAGTLEVLSPILARIRAQSEPAKKVPARRADHRLPKRAHHRSFAVPGHARGSLPNERKLPFQHRAGGNGRSV